MLKGLIEGRLVHYVIKAADVPAEFAHCEGRHRAAVIVNAWPELGRPDGYANLTVLLDWSNDGNFSTAHHPSRVSPPGAATVWITSALNDEQEKKPGTWHWIEREPVEAMAEAAVPVIPAEVVDQRVRDIVRELVKGNALK